MFDIFFGWSKASKCKKLLKRGQCRLKLIKNKRSSIARLLREDVAELILAAHPQTAFNRVEQLCNDLSLVSAYELLDQFCEFILVHLSYIRRHKDIPNDINEAVSSLIFASARCGDVPELRGIRKLFAERYGQRYATAAVELFPGNLVNHQIIEKLSGKAVPHDVKLKLFNEIVRGCSIKRDLLALEFASELQKQEKENSKNQALDMYLLTYYNEVKGFRIQDSSAKDTEGAARSADNKCSSRSCQTSRQNSGMTSISISSSIARQSSNDTESQLYEQEEEPVLSVEAVRQHIGKIRATNSSSSSESSYQCPDENLIYLDDIEEFESPNAKDQRLFIFNSSSKKESQIWRQSPSMDMEYYIYDGELSTQKRITHHNRKNCSDKCSLEHPCYCCSGDEHHVAAVYDVFTYQDPKPNTKSNGTTHDFGSNPRMAEPPYRRAATMPQERATERNIRRSNSCLYKHPSHVHPKLPDYDDISAKFMALKKDQHQNKVSDRETRLV